MMICPYCGEEIEESLEKCPCCEGQLQEVSVFHCPLCAESIRPNTRICPYCESDIGEEINIPRRKCPYCAEWIPSAVDLCPYCDSKLSGDTDIGETRKCSFCAEPIPAGKMICPYCGKSLDQSFEDISEGYQDPTLPFPDARNASVRDASSPSSEMPTKERRASRWIGIAMGLAIILVIVFNSDRFAGLGGSKSLSPTPTTRSAQSMGKGPSQTPWASPTANPLISKGCVAWSEIDDRHIGKRMCVYGIARLVEYKQYEQGHVFTIQFSDDWYDFKIQDFNFFYQGISEGTCISARGEVIDNVSFLILKPDKNQGSIEAHPYSLCH